METRKNTLVSASVMMPSKRVNSPIMTDLMATDNIMKDSMLSTIAEPMMV